MKKLSAVVLLIFIMCAAISCNATDTASMGGAQHGITPSYFSSTPLPLPTPKTIYSAEVLKPLASPKITKIVEFEHPSDLNEFFSSLSGIVQGTVTDVTEYKLTGKQENSAIVTDIRYITVITLSVQKSYCDNKLINSGFESISFEYFDSTHDKAFDAATNQQVTHLSIGDACIVFMTDIGNSPSMTKHAVNEYADYTVLYPFEGICIKKGDKYRAEHFMRLCGASGELFGREEIEKFIEKNIALIPSAE